MTTVHHCGPPAHRAVDCSVDAPAHVGGMARHERHSPNGDRDRRARERDELAGGPRRDRWNAAGGYSEERPVQGVARPHRTAPYGSGPVPEEGSLRASNRGQGPLDFTRSDERVLEEVCALLEDSDVDASAIEVRVADGEVVLEGTVDDELAKREAEDVAREARGVKEVHNLLCIARVGNGASPPAHGDRPPDRGRP
jgi:BON domain-containing protein